MKFQTLAKKQCLTIDLKHVNDLGSSKFRTGAKNNKEQVCDYNFLAVRKETSTDAIIFSIANLIDKSNKHKDTYYKIGDELREFNDVAIQLKPGVRATLPEEQQVIKKQQQQQQQYDTQR